MESSTVLSPIPDSAHIKLYDIIIDIVGCSIFGLMGIVFNVFILVVVGKNKTLQTSCFLLICAECIFSICFCIGDHIANIQITSIMAGLINVNRSRALCYITMPMPILMGVQGSNLMISCVAMDRLLSILSPTVYRNMGNRYTKACWAVCFPLVLISAVIGVFSPPWGMMDSVECSFVFSAVSEGYLAYHGLLGITFSGLCVLLYSAMFVAFKWRKTTIKDPNAVQVFLKQQQACLPTVRLLMIMYGIFSVTPEICIFTLASSPSARVYSARVSNYIGPIKTASSLAQIIALYFGSSQFKKCARKMLGMEKSTGVIAPTTSAPPVRRNTQVHALANMEIKGVT